jgi:hypothetical protein
MLALGFLLVGAGAAAMLIGLFSSNGHFFGWGIGTHPALFIGFFSAVAVLTGLALVRWGTVHGVKQALRQRRLQKDAAKGRASD